MYKEECVRLNAEGIQVTAIPYGAAVQSILLTLPSGEKLDVVLGFDTLEEYKNSSLFFGATIGRIANRIGGAAFRLNGKEYPVAKNDGENHLHGGLAGFDKKNWEITGRTDCSAVFSLTSPDGEEGYPGNLKVSVSFSVDDTRALRIVYEAVPDADTVINLTNHSYFNLNGHDSGNAMNHLLQLNADRTTENGPGCLPTGRILPVDGTPFDFREKKALAPGLASGDPGIETCLGYDHNFVLNGSGLRKIGTLTGDRTGVSMDVFTDQPGVQLYSGNFITPTNGKDGAKYDYRHAVCLETQHFPDAIHHPEFPSVILKKDERFRSETVYRFSF